MQVREPTRQREVEGGGGWMGAHCNGASRSGAVTIGATPTGAVGQRSNPPTVVALRVAGLAVPDVLVEIEATAVLP